MSHRTSFYQVPNQGFLKHIGHMQTQSRRSFLNSPSRRNARDDDYWLHVNRAAMACRFEVTLPMRDRAGVVVATEALNEVDALEAQLTVFRESSEVSHVNRHAATEPVVVEQALFDLLVLCKDLYRETEGAFDITSGPLTRCWGFLRREGRVPENQEIESARSLVGSDKLLLDHASRTIRFAQPGVEINLGSIGKGYALDRVASLIEKRVQTALLNAGASSIRAIGSGSATDRRSGGWQVGLRHPRSKNRRLGIVGIRDCTVSTSGAEEQFFEHNGKRYGHIIDPRTGWPAGNVTSVTVLARAAAISDALATAFYVGGRELAERYCSTHRDILVIMLESDAQSPVVIGSNKGCEIQCFRMNI
ncbi:MAG: FAD:protein FMN transferase [Pyrinomonadaceae bacterium]